MRKLGIALVLLIMVGCAQGKEEALALIPMVTSFEIMEDETVTLSFVAVGDNLIHGAIYASSKTGENTYDFSSIYEHTNAYTQEADVAYVNMETIAGGVELGLSSYPTFNGPHEIIDGLHNAGFDWVSASSNHSFDRQELGILSELTYAKKFPDMYFTGAHQSEADKKKPQVMLRDGIRIGILGYTYGLNGFELPQGKEYLVDLIDKQQIKEDVEALKKVSDIQMVSMHWGEEYQFEPNETQVELAQYLSDLGVSVVIGAHPHVIQPMDRIVGKNGNETLVMYSLGNFLSAQDENYRMLGGMGSWNIAFNKSDQSYKIKDIAFIPLVTQIENNFTRFSTYALKDYTDELASKHTMKLDYNQDVSRKYFVDLTKQVMKDNVEIIY